MEILEIEGLRRIKRDSLGCNVLQKYAHWSSHAKSILHDSRPLSLRIHQHLSIDLIRVVPAKKYLIIWCLLEDTSSLNQMTNSVLYYAKGSAMYQSVMIIKTFYFSKISCLFSHFILRYICPCFLLAGEDSPELAEIKRINRELQVGKQEHLVKVSLHWKMSSAFCYLAQMFDIYVCWMMNVQGSTLEGSFHFHLLKDSGVVKDIHRYTHLFFSWH